MQYISLLAQDGSLQMWFTMLLILITIILYASDKVSLEVTSVVVFSALLLFFHFFPLFDDAGQQKIDTMKILSGFANPALVTVIGLLIVGHAVVQTGALNEVANVLARVSGNNAVISLGLCFVVVVSISAVMNNTPVVVIFIPILAALARNLDISVSGVMIPLSYAAILGGMTTLIGSSTNLLVSGALQEMGFAPLSFFEFTIPGLVMAGVGFIYVLFLAPRLLPDRASLAKSMMGDDDRQFISQIEIDRTSDLAGKVLADGTFPGFEDIAIRMIQRGEHAFLPPFDENMTIRPRDIIIVAATRNDLKELLKKQPISLLQSSPGAAQIIDDEDAEMMQEDVNMAEVIITPSSRMIGRNLEQIGFYYKHNCVVLGVQRQSRIIRARISEIRLAAGDVLLVMGKRDDLMKLRESKDVLLLEWSTEEIHSGKKAWQAGGILACVVSLAALDIVPIVISSFIGATAAIISGCLNFRQALRAIDSQVVLIVAASLGLGAALQATGGATYIAHLLVSSMDGASPVVVMSALFVLMMVATNVLSNNASAVLFTPIAVGAAVQLGVNPLMFVYAVIFACNCSFVTPIGYQTNLLVMGPGHYKFVDYIKSGLPLALVMWLTYTLFAPWYFSVK